MIKKLTVIAAAIFLALVLFLVCAESCVRIVSGRPVFFGMTTNDPVFHHIPKPYCKGTLYSKDEFDVPFVTNNRGMRGPGDYSYEKKKDVYRIAVLGDSFTFGVGVRAEETMPALLEKMLNEPKERRYEVYNFGVQSYSPLLEYIYLKNEVIKYRPDMVMLMFDISDVQDDWRYEPHIVRNAQGDIEGCDPMKIGGLPDLHSVLLKYSRLYSLLDMKLFQSFRKIKAIGFANYFTNKFKGKRNKTEILANKDIDNIYFDKFIMFREGKDRDIVMRHWNRTAQYLEMIKNYCDEKNIKFIMVIYPYGHQVDVNQFATGRKYWGFEQGKVYDPKEGFAIIKDFARALGIRYIDLTAPLVENRGELLYFESDGHWTKRGNEVAARAILKEVL